MRINQKLLLIFFSLFSLSALADIQQRIAIYTQQAELFREICFTPSGVFYKDKIFFDVHGSIDESSFDCNAQALALEEERLAIEAALASDPTCQDQTVKDQGLIDLLNGSSGVVGELTCPGIGDANACMAGISCNLLSSIIPLGASAARFAFSDHPTLKSCGSGGNCFTNIGKAIWDNLWDTVTGLYDLGKMGLSWLGDRLGSLWRSEDATSNRGIAATEISDSQLDQFLADPVDYIFNFGKRMLGMITEGISKRYGCAEWTGTPHLSECIRPMSWDCASCNEKLNMVCGVTSYIGANFVTAFFTGGATAVAQITAKVAASTTMRIARAIPGASRIAETMAASGKLTRAGGLLSGSIKSVWTSLAESRTVKGISSVARELKASAIATNSFARKNIFLYAPASDAILASVRAYKRLSQSGYVLGYRSTKNAADSARGYLYSQYPKLSDINSGVYTNVNSPSAYFREATKSMTPAERSNMRLTITTDKNGQQRVVIHDTRPGDIKSDISYNFTPEPPPSRGVVIAPLPQVTEMDTIVVTARISDQEKLFRSGSLGRIPPPKNEFVETWSSRVVTSPRQNAQYIETALKGKEPGLFFLDTQNTALKRLNDTLRDKSLVDAFGNRYNSLVDEALREFKLAHPEATVTMYSDYKSMRASIRGPPGKEDELMKELGLLLDKTDEAFRNELRAGNYVPEDLINERWFRGGLGRTADEANLVTRFSRREGDVPTTAFSAAAAQDRIKTAWEMSNLTRAQIEKRFKGTPLLQDKIPTAEVLEVVRKNQNASDVAKILSGRLGIKVTEKDAEMLGRYFEQVDQFSPGLLIPSRVEHRFDDATHGGFSIDFAGVGSVNAEATASGLAFGKTLDEAILSVRSRELTVTRDLDALKERTENAVKEVLDRHQINSQITVSGDDMLVVPDRALTPEIRREIAEAQVKAQRGTSTQASGMRTSFFNEGIPDQASRSIQATIGETIEKKLRKRLEGKIPHEQMKDTLFAVDMRGRSPGTGSVGVEVVNPNLTPETRALIQREFKASVEDINTELKSTGQAGNLST